MASPEKQDEKKKSSLRSKKHSKPQMQDSKSGSSRSKLLESGISGSQKVGHKKQTITLMSKKADMVNGAASISNKLAHKRKKALPKQRRNYSLRSLDRGRVLRSKLDTKKCKTKMNPASNPEKLVTRKKKGGKKKVKKSGQDELSRIKKHIRYMLNRMNYEQSLIDAYSGEGWKGQSAEKIRPEKELDRAKSEILRCKLKMREIFQHLDSLLAEGRLQESLFDSDGIDSESIFCGKCGSVEVPADNDIILCDGVCERGFHQKCLNPPLLSEDIPIGDEGWLCPQCDCKVECIDLLDEFQGTDLSIEDSWERIFPEAAVLANGNLNLPSDDSEDDDYDPDARRVDVIEQEEGSGCEESDSSSSSYDSTSSDDNMNQATVELSSDDSEDDDYDPDAPDPDKEIHKSKSSSDESDFTSDSDEFCAELKKISYAEDASASSLPSLDIFFDSGRDEMKDEDKLYDYSEVPTAKQEIDKQESGLISSHKRFRERLDYKKLYDEAYGKSSSDSSEDEEWNGKSSPKKLKKTDDKRSEEVANDSFVKTTSKVRKKIASSAAEKDHGSPEPHSSGRSSAFVLKKSGVAFKKLDGTFQENQYPSREKKEELAQELGMTFRKVSRWFESARRRSRASSKESGNPATSSLDKAEASCRTPGSHEHDTGEEEKIGLSFTPDKAIILFTTPTSNAKPDDTASSRNNAISPKSPTKPDHEKDSDSPIANGAVSADEEGKKAGDDRRKAIAKELRRMRKGR